ncbi:helix-turn-helix domain-containing protein, partial [Halorhodospira halochloris]|nr:helix-turn-helix domain-containing protein [Halorhodospira halochloris]
MQLHAQKQESRLLLENINPSKAPGNALRNSTHPVRNAVSLILLSLLGHFLPQALQQNILQPMTLISLAQQLSSYPHRKRTLEGIEQSPKQGRPPIPEAVVDCVLAIHFEHPEYSPRRIANAIRLQLGEHAICPETVRKIIRKHGFTPPENSKGRKSANPGWMVTINNHLVCSMDFKVTFCLRGIPIYILNIINNGTKELIHI